MYIMLQGIAGTSFVRENHNEAYNLPTLSVNTPIYKHAINIGLNSYETVYVNVSPNTESCSMNSATSLFRTANRESRRVILLKNDS